jgi:hypothetical protein
MKLKDLERFRRYLRHRRASNERAFSSSSHRLQRSLGSSLATLARIRRSKAAMARVREFLRQTG